MLTLGLTLLTVLAATFTRAVVVALCVFFFLFGWMLSAWVNKSIFNHKLDYLLKKYGLNLDAALPPVPVLKPQKVFFP